MLNEAHYQSVLNFYYFLLLNEETTLGISYKTIKAVQKKALKSPELKVDVILIGKMVENLEKFRASRIPLGAPSMRSDWKVKSPQHLIGWREFMRSCDAEYSVALVLHYVLGYPINIISEGLNIPVGTVYYRLGRGLEAMAKNTAIQAIARRDI